MRHARVCDTLLLRWWQSFQDANTKDFAAVRQSVMELLSGRSHTQVKMYVTIGYLHTELNACE